MKKQAVAAFFAAFALLGAPILAFGTTESHSQNRGDPLPLSDEYNHYDESLQPAENTLASPEPESAATETPAIPEEVAEANQSGADLMEPLSKITE